MTIFSQVKRVVFLLVVVILGLNAENSLVPLHIEGRQIMAGDVPVVLRGINWGWWKHQETIYREDDMRKQAEWGANVVRFTFFCKDIADENFVFCEERMTDFDEVIDWAEKYNQYVILDMHEIPGGQNTAVYTNGASNQVWDNPEYQEKFLELWRRLAARYKDNPVVAAYEVINEPETRPREPSRVAALNRRVVEAIREIDPDKIIVVSGDNWSEPKNLSDCVFLDEPNILYTIHLYQGAYAGLWFDNLQSSCHVDGNTPWKEFRLEFVSSERARAIAPLLRSENNSGTAWFDDIELHDENGKLLYSSHFDSDNEGYSKERSGFGGNATYEQADGHDAAGCLCFGGSDTYNGWIGPHWLIEPGRKYVLTGWIKTADATGKTWLGGAFFGASIHDDKALKDLFQPAVDFSRKFNVPVFVGEFAVARNAGLDDSYQAVATEKRIALFEEQQFSWTYWNYRETTHTGSMALQPQKKDGTDFPINQPLLDVLKKAWNRNKETTAR